MGMQHTLASLISESNESESPALARQSWMRYVLSRVAEYPPNRRLVDEWKLMHSVEESDIQKHRELVAMLAKRAQRALEPAHHEDIVTQSSNASYYVNFRVGDPRVTHQQAARVVERVYKRSGCNDFVTENHQDSSGFSCSFHVGSLWLPVVSHPRGDETLKVGNSEGDGPSARDIFNMSTSDWSRETPYLALISNLRPSYKDDPFCKQLEECVVSCKVSLNIGLFDAGDDTLGVFMSVSDLLLDGWTGKRVRVDYLYSEMIYTLASLISESSDDASPDDITNARISWIRHVISRVLNHPVNSRLCRLYGIKEQSSWEDDPSQGYLDRMRWVSSQISKFPSLRKTYSNKFFVKGWNSSRDMSELPELTHDVFDRIESLGYERKEFKHIGVTDSCEFYIDVGTLWLPVITLSRGNEVSPEFAVPGQLDALMANVIVSHEIRKTFAERSYVGIISRLRPIAKDDPHCKSLEAYRVCIKFDVQVNVDNDIPYVALESNQYVCVMQSLGKRMPVEYLYSEMIYTLRSLITEGLDDLAAGRSVLPDDEDGARLEMRRRVAREGFLAARRLTVPQKTPSDETFHRVISRSVPSASFTVEPSPGASGETVVAECDVFVHSPTHLTSTDIDNRLIEELKRLYGQPLYTDDDGYPVWSGQHVWVPVFHTLKRGIVRYMREGEVGLAPHGMGRFRRERRPLDPRVDARMALSDDPANIHGLKPDFFNEQESPSAYDTIETLPPGREYDITKIELQEWKTVFSVSTTVYFSTSDDEIEPDDILTTECYGTIQINLDKRILTIPTGRKKVLK